LSKRLGRIRFATNQTVSRIFSIHHGSLPTLLKPVMHDTIRNTTQQRKELYRNILYETRQYLYTYKEMQPLKHFLHDTHLATRRWHLGQFRNNEPLRQGEMRIAGQGTVNNVAEEYQSESGGDNEEGDQQGDGGV
jgi:hypothetical protein